MNIHVHVVTKEYFVSYGTICSHGNGGMIQLFAKHSSRELEHYQLLVSFQTFHIETTFLMLRLSSLIRVTSSQTFLKYFRMSDDQPSSSNSSEALKVTFQDPNYVNHLNMFIISKVDEIIVPLVTRINTLENHISTVGVKVDWLLNHRRDQDKKIADLEAAATRYGVAVRLLEKELKDLKPKQTDSPILQSFLNQQPSTSKVNEDEVMMVDIPPKAPPVIVKLEDGEVPPTDDEVPNGPKCKYHPLKPPFLRHGILSEDELPPLVVAIKEKNLVDIGKILYAKVVVDDKLVNMEEISVAVFGYQNFNMLPDQRKWWELPRIGKISNNVTHVEMGKLFHPSDYHVTACILKDGKHRSKFSLCDCYPHE